MFEAPLPAARYEADRNVAPAVRASSRPASRLSAAWALRAAGLCLLGLAATWILAELVPATHVRDAVVLDDFMALGRPRVDRLANDLLGLLSPLLYTLWGLVLVATALLRRRPLVALAVALVLPAAPLAAEAIKPLLAYPHTQAGAQWITAASWPSGHATAAMTLVLCALLVAPHRLRPTVAALGSAFAVAVGFSLLILAWHMPSDVLGGYLLAALFTSLAVAALRAVQARRALGGAQKARLPLGGAQRRERRIGPSAPASPEEARWRGEDLVVPALIVLAAMLTIAGALLLRAAQVESFASDHRLLVLAGAGICSLVVLISSTLTIALRH
jgi:membrane-associated phospholipid phosphatase